MLESHVKVKRISPEENVTLEITAPKKEWERLVRHLGENHGYPDDQNTFVFFKALHSEFNS